MKRMHIHISVNEMEKSIGFYSSIFGVKPTIERDDYAKWQVDEPAVNFAISNRGHAIGVNHLGIQVDSEAELEDIAQRLDDAEITTATQIGTSCCYAHSNKHWAMDPQGVAWESFHTLKNLAIFGEQSVATNDEQSDQDQTDAACCVSNETSDSACC